MTMEANVKRDSQSSKADEEEQIDTTAHVCKLPKDQGLCGTVFWVIQYPAYLVFFLTIPDCKVPKLRKLFPVTFCMCVIWIGFLSYLVAWMITCVGDTFRIPDSVMGITFLAVGTSVPEAVSSVIVAKRGYGSMAICNSIGSNTFDILVCLGVPWVIKTLAFPCEGTNNSLNINSSGLMYSTLTLLSTLFMLYICFACTKFTLGWTVGLACLICYMGFVVFAVAMEMNVFFVVNLPMCDR